MPGLFDPITVGDLQLPNRIFMAPLTRSRASGDGRVPNELMVEYYAQRASAGLILSEATAITPMGVGYPDTPGIWSQEQVEGWKQVTQAVHTQGGHIFLQLWHVGRISHPVYLNGELPVAPSAIRPDGYLHQLQPRSLYETPRALETNEISGIIDAYRKAAANAQAAGFDGIEIHGANGYLPDQFLQDSTNHRTDSYGGSISNRARFLLEVTDAAIGVWGRQRVGVHLSPRGDSHSMGDSDRGATFGYVASELGRRQIAFLCVREALGPDRLGPRLKKAFGGVYVVNERFTKETAEQVLEGGEADAVAFGVQFLANPDLPRRFKLGLPLNEPDPSTFYTPGPKGYIDYPALAEVLV